VSTIIRVRSATARHRKSARNRQYGLERLAKVRTTALDMENEQTSIND
jgi:hypothetical protein